MQTMEKLVKGVLTATQAPSTKDERTSTQIAHSLRLFQSRSRYKRPTPEHQRLFDGVSRFASELNFARPHWLCLLGNSGIGKTHLAREVYRHFMDYSRFELSLDAERYRIDGNTGQYVDWRKFASELRGGSFGRLEDIERDWFVVLDDIGSEHDPSGFIASVLDRICNSRSDITRPKWTLITCNLGLSQIAEKIDTRIADRMLRNGSVVIETNLESWALRAHGL